MRRGIGRPARLGPISVALSGQIFAAAMVADGHPPRMSPATLVLAVLSLAAAMPWLSRFGLGRWRDGAVVGAGVWAICALALDTAWWHLAVGTLAGVALCFRWGRMREPQDVAGVFE